MNEGQQLLQEAAQEITSLRNANSIMSARLEMFDNMMMLFTTEPNFKRQGMSPDVVYAINKHLSNELSETKVNGASN